MKCAYCGNENAEGESYCASCGMKLGGPSGTPPPATPKPPASPISPGMIRCVDCGFMNPGDASICQGCGQPLAPTPPSATPVPTPPSATPSGMCPNCGYDKNPAIAKFCMNCGATLMPASGPVPAPPPTPAAPSIAKLVLPGAAEIPIPASGKTIGRADFIKHVSPEEAKFVSREHLKIVSEYGKYYIIDEGSTNGTRLNGTEIKELGRKELTNNDKIVLGDAITLRFQTH
ncbi:MAG: zinc ribbon domain-containing protein [Candidatus Methanofastidiosia archaeon]